MGLAVTDYRDDYKPEAIRSARHYDGSLQGRGRSVVLSTPLGRPAVRLFTDDKDRLGYMQVSDHPEAIALAQTLAQALLGARYADATTTDVFDHWAQMEGPQIGAGEIVVGDLELLSPTPRDTP